MAFAQNYSICKQGGKVVEGLSGSVLQPSKLDILEASLTSKPAVENQSTLPQETNQEKDGGDYNVASEQTR